jgi:hypothetical protein
MSFESNLFDAVTEEEDEYEEEEPVEPEEVREELEGQN